QRTGPDTAVVTTNKESLPKGVPDVQVMVGPGARGYTVAFVFPKKVDVKVVRSLVDSYAKLSGASVSGLTIETSRLEHEPGAKIANEPLMTSATFETKAELVNRQSGGFFPEKMILALQQFDRVQVTFLVEQAFAFARARHFNNENLTVDVFGQQGAFTFVANIRKRPVTDFVVPEQDAAVVRTKPKRKASNALLLLIVGLAVASGLAVTVIVKRNVGR
ncbi:MAG: hypothetical protein RLZZ78_339, partial [Armatimonadota bacterium]